MSSLGEKLDARKELLEVMDDAVEYISEKQAVTLNRLFCVFNKNFVLEKNENGVYEVEKINLLYDRCLEMIKKEYSTKFMTHLYTMLMVQE